MMVQMAWTQRISALVVMVCGVLLASPAQATAAAGGHWCNTCEWDMANSIAAGICEPRSLPPQFVCGYANSCWWDDAFEEYVIGVECYDNQFDPCPTIMPNPDC